ncbi:MAG: hypothetical protein M3512_15330 [Bacteroidota bacterium]|nr:hypothetical protein [Bacteroidota bacterium]
MASTEQIRNNLIDKLISIKNKDILSAVDRLLEVSIKEEDIYKVSEDQRKSLQASEIDIVNGKLISDEDLNNEEDELLREKSGP